MGCKPIHKIRHINDFRDMLEQTEKLYGNRVAYKFKTKVPGEFDFITHKEFKSDIESLATGLIDLGYQGKRIAVISENRYEWGITYLAVTCSGGIIVPLDKSLPANEIEDSILRSEVEVVVYSQKYDEIMANIKLHKAPDLMCVSMDLENNEDEVLSQKMIIKKGRKLLSEGDRRYENVQIDNEKMSIMLFTSGTTSLAKIVMLSQKNICANIMDIASVLEVNENDTFLSFLPLHHTFECTTGFLYPAYTGAAIAYCDGIRHFTENLKEYQISAMVSVPVMFESVYKRVWANIKKSGKQDKVEQAIRLSNLLLKVGIDVRRKLFKDIHDALGGKQRLFISGAAGLDPEVEKGYKDFGFRLAQGYGLTETSPVLSTGNDKHNKIGSVGLPLPNVKIKIDNPDKDGIGEIMAKGPNVMMGYYNNEEENSEAIKKGWFYTGDLGYIDKEGFLFITGRKKSVIVLKNGKNVFPEEIETLLNKSDYINESFVYGKTAKDDSVMVCAKLVYNKEAIKEEFGEKTKEEIYDILWKEVKNINKKMPTYKYIKDIIVTEEELIKTTTRKVKRHEELAKIFESNKII